MENVGTDAKTEAPVLCPRCGKNIKDKQLHVSDDVVKDYVRHMLGGRRFSKTFKLLGNTLYVTLEEPTAYSDISNPLPTYSEALLEDRYLLLTLSSVDLVDESEGTTRTIYSKSSEEREELIKDIPTGIKALSERVSSVQFNMIKRCVVTFAALLGLIESEVRSEDFYEGAGLF